ncbi:MAG: hypothetical protein AAFR79_13490 [Pseudomonadota bacterium]
MAHVRQQLREAAIAALGNIAAFEGRVTALRAHARNIGDLPAAQVSVPIEENERLDTQALLRRLELQVMVLAASSAVEDDLDALAVSIETAITGSAAVQAVASDIYLSGAAVEIGDPGETKMAELTLSFATVVMTPDDDPETVEGV